MDARAEASFLDRLDEKQRNIIKKEGWDRIDLRAEPYEKDWQE